MEMKPHEYTRTPQDVVGNDPELLRYWDSIPDKIQKRLLASTITVSTLGELQIMVDQLKRVTDDPPTVF